MYKDPDKQREAVRLATRRYRARQQGITKVSHNEGITDRVSPSLPVIPEDDVVLVDTEAHERVYRHDLQQWRIQPKPKTQSYNPMMVGYVPPRE